MSLSPVFPAPLYIVDANLMRSVTQLPVLAELQTITGRLWLWVRVLFDFCVNGHLHSVKGDTSRPSEDYLGS